MDSPKVLIFPEAKLVRPRLTLLQNSFRNAKPLKTGRLPHLLEIAEQLHPPTRHGFLSDLLEQLESMTTVVLEPKETALLHPVINDRVAVDRLKTFLMLRHITYFESRDIRLKDLDRREAAKAKSQSH